MIIADDELHICQLLESLIDWKAAGFEIEGFASSGYEAANLCTAHRPDLLITDIRMPGLGGLELVQHLHEQMPSVQVIIITGYSQFQYAHQALRYGVVDYLLKPIRAAELLTALGNVRERIESASAPAPKPGDSPVSVKSMQEIKGNILFSLLSSRDNPSSLMRRDNLLEELHIGFAGNAWHLVQVEVILGGTYDNFSVEDYLEGKINEIFSEEFREEHLELIFSRTAEGYFCLINGMEENFRDLSAHLQTIKFILMQVLGLFEKGTFTIGVSGLYTHFNQIGFCIEECGRAVDQKIIAGKNQVICYSDMPSCLRGPEEFITEDFERDFKNAVADANLAVVSGRVSGLMSTLNLMSHQISGTLVNEVYASLIRLFFSACRVFGTEDYGAYSEEQLISQGKYFYSITAAFTYLGNLFRTILSALVEKRGEQSTKPIRMAQMYIDEHYMEAVKLQEVAEYVGLAPAYLSSLFKKQVGKSLVEYLTHIRIQNAKQLLMDKNRNIADISDEVGFVDVKYFIKRFKKVTGLTPNEYRKLFGGR